MVGRVILFFCNELGCNMRKLLLFLMLFILALFAATLFLKNGQHVTVSYYFNFEQVASLASVMLVCFACGLIVGALIMSVSLFKSKHVANKTKKQLSKVEKEVGDLRSLQTNNNVSTN